MAILLVVGLSGQNRPQDAQASIHRHADGDRLDLLHATPADADIPVVEIHGRVAVTGDQAHFVVDACPESAGGSLCTDRDHFGVPRRARRMAMSNASTPGRVIPFVAPAPLGPGRDMRHLHPRPRPDVGRSRPLALWPRPRQINQ